MFVYLGIFACLAIVGLFLPDRKSGTFFVVAAPFLVWFMGFRYETGCDFHGYLHRWVHFPEPIAWRDILLGTEPGFGLLIGTVKASGASYIYLNVMASVILVTCYIIFARAHRFAPLILALLFPVIIIQLGMSGIRQALAGGFLMLAFNSFVQRNKLMTAVWILAGMQFHTSVVMFLPLALLAGRDVSTPRLALALAVLGPAAAILLADRFDTYADRYIEGNVTSGGAIIRYALILIPVPIFIFFRSKVKQAFPEVYPLLKLFALVILALAPLVVLSSIALHRLNYYVMPASVLLFVYTGAMVFRRDQKALGHFLAVLTYGLYSFSWFLTSKHAYGCYIPYENTLFLQYPPPF